LTIGNQSHKTLGSQIGEFFSSGTWFLRDLQSQCKIPSVRRKSGHGGRSSSNHFLDLFSSSHFRSMASVGSKGESVLATSQAEAIRKIQQSLHITDVRLQKSERIEQLLQVKLKRRSMTRWTRSATFCNHGLQEVRWEVQTSRLLGSNPLHHLHQAPLFSPLMTWPSSRSKRQKVKFLSTRLHSSQHHTQSHWVPLQNP
jgi:hypothetical protein